MPDDFLQLLVAAVGGGTGIGATILILRIALPIAKRSFGSLVGIRASIDASRDRLIDSLQEERTECDRQLDEVRAELIHARSELAAAHTAALAEVRSWEQLQLKKRREVHQLRDMVQVMLDMAPQLRLSDVIERLEDPPVVSPEWGRKRDPR